MLRTLIQLLVMVLVLLLLLSLPSPAPVHRGFLVAGTDMFWETFDAEFNKCPDEKRAIEMLKARGYEIYE